MLQCDTLHTASITAHTQSTQHNNGASNASAKKTNTHMTKQQTHNGEKKTKCTHGWASKIKDHTATKPRALKGWPREDP